MECQNCGDKISEGQLCSKCLGKKAEAKQDIKKRFALMIFAICILFLSFFLASVINVEIIQKALSLGVAVSAIYTFFAALFTMIKSYSDYKHFCQLENKNDMQVSDVEEAEINEDALKRYLSNRKKD